MPMIVRVRRRRRVRRLLILGAVIGAVAAYRSRQFRQSPPPAFTQSRQN
jgi:hypothetical protein